jgi:hypothetical protein
MLKNENLNQKSTIVYTCFIETIFVYLKLAMGVIIEWGPDGKI